VPANSLKIEAGALTMRRVALECKSVPGIWGCEAVLRLVDSQGLPSNEAADAGNGLTRLDRVLC